MICNKCKKDVIATIHDICIECHDDIPKDPIVEAVVEKYQKRSTEGMIKYGVTMERKDLSTLDWLNHLMEELMDATLYLERMKRDLQDESYEDWHFRMSEYGAFDQSNNENES